MTPKISAKRTFSFILQAIKPFKGCIAIMLAVAILWSLELSLLPYLLKVILNSVGEPLPTDLFSHVAIPVILYVSIMTLMSTFFRLYDYFVTIKMIPNMRQMIANQSFGLLLSQSHRFYLNQFSGSLTNKINDLTRSIPEILQIIIDRFIVIIITLCIAICFLWQVNYRFALATLLWSGSLLVVALFKAKHLTQLSAAWSEKGSTITGRMVDVLSNSLSVRLFARKSKEKMFLAETFKDATQAEQKLHWAYFWIWLCYGYSFCVMLAFNLFFLIKGRQNGWITVGDFALVLTINISIADTLWQSMKDFSQFSKLFGRINQALETVLIPTELADDPDAKELMVADKGEGGCEIAFDKVKFQYPGSDALFHNKSITIKRGEKVGLVGYSGSGKSSFVNLILRLFDVTSGRILIDGQDISQVTQESLRSTIGMIPQDPSLFHRTLMENIRYGSVDATNKDVIEAAKKAHAHEFITHLSQKYESEVGERGVKLSGGQRQRIAIARAILKNAPILILDEATSQLDSVTEQLIQESLWELMEGKTTLVIAHRLSTLLHMDRILVFDKGKIVEDGTHQELLMKDGLYRTLWDAQVGGFIMDE